MVSSAVDALVAQDLVLPQDVAALRTHGATIQRTGAFR